MKIGEVFRSADFKNEKHVPVIELATKPVAGEPLKLSVTVGKEIPHPNTTEHFIAWISLYYKIDGDPNVYELGKVEFNAHGGSAKGPNTLILHTIPTADFTVKLDKPGSLIATSYCNIHGLWESSVRIEF